MLLIALLTKFFFRVFLVGKCKITQTRLKLCLETYTNNPLQKTVPEIEKGFTGYST